MVTAAHHYGAVVARRVEARNADGAEAVAGLRTADGRCADPLPDAVVREAITAVIAAAHERFPGFAFRLVGNADGHHDTARSSREPVNRAGGSAPVAGSAVITLGAGDRVRAVHGFPDRVPEAA
ncbi:nuclear transport factor 2 family protein [Streptomyces sp. NPDC000348]|uniref:nuclear transport factor 2 family protein n=1 Tax=Streptomyces sp. NPDC000348 TaxID=3364538 RepID=UPI0036919E3B